MFISIKGRSERCTAATVVLKIDLGSSKKRTRMPRRNSAPRTRSIVGLTIAREHLCAASEARRCQAALTNIGNRDIDRFPAIATHDPKLHVVADPDLI